MKPFNLDIHVLQFGGTLKNHFVDDSYLFFSVVFFFFLETYYSDNGSILAAPRQKDRKGQKKPSPPSPSLPSGHPQGGASSKDVERWGCGVTNDVSMRLLCLGSLCPPWGPRTLGRRLTLSGLLGDEAPACRFCS